MKSPAVGLQIEKAIYGGDGLAHTAAGEVVFLPFVLPGETVVPGPTPAEVQVLNPSPDRVKPQCVHFGICGGCQYQMAGYETQLSMKVSILRETLDRAGLRDLPEPQAWASPQPWGYRNRIRLRVRDIDGTLRLGYSLRDSRTFLPIQMCPIAAPVLWAAAEALTRAARDDRNAADWLAAAAEAELLCDAPGAKVQIHLLCPGKVPQSTRGFARLMEAVGAAGVPVVSGGASRLHTASGRPAEELASWGQDGLPYRVGDDSFWLKRGSFFQVNRFLVPGMADLVCGGRRGELAWDLFAGVGLFARRLARSFAGVTAVEASPLAVTELRRGLGRPTDRAIQQTTLAFLRAAVVQRERPDLIVLDPPRAGAGEEACALLLRLAPGEIVYVSCDPSTLARDLAVLVAGGYAVAETHMLDLFPQTYHLETVMVLRRTPVAALRG